MSTKMSARGIVGSLRLVGVTAAVAVGIAGFGATPASAATTAAPSQFQLTDAQGAQLTQLVNRLDLPQITLKAKTCNRMSQANVPAEVLVKLGCVIVPVDGGEILGGSVF